MNYQSKLTRLEERAHARREELENVCTCEPIIIIEGEPTEEQQRELEARAPCKLHSDVVSIIEVPPMPEWMKAGMSRPLREVELEELEESASGELLEESIDEELEA
ncbi:MAG TPA: hypothetical protein VM911_10870 [Pyrinomonadaceae bacterium]|jgi:hypothetical protein|nr:hypothetical protein [Pyrinomonadaceae bacterium]